MDGANGTMLRNRSFPPWAGPPFGALVGAIAAWKVVRRFDVTMLVMATLGAFAGCVMWIWDSEPAERASGPESLWARVAAALGLLSILFVIVWGILLLLATDSYSKAHPTPIPMELYVATLIGGVALPVGTARFAQRDLRANPHKQGVGLVRFVYVIATVDALLLAIVTLMRA